MHWTKGPNAKDICARISAEKTLNPTRFWLGKTHSKMTRGKISVSKISSELTTKGERHHNWKGGHSPEAYRRTTKNGEKRYAHRVVFEAAIKRPLGALEIVHHCDGNRKNNELGNLMLFRSRKAHARLHSFTKRHGLPILMTSFEQPWLFTITHT